MKSSSPHVQRILVPTDFSPYSAAAFNYAMDLAHELHATVDLLHVQSPGSAPENSDWQPLSELKAGEPTSRKGKKRPRDIPLITTIESTLPVAEVILEQVAATGCQLVVMGTHGRTGLKHLLMGSVTEKIVRLSPVPVLTTHDAPPKFRIRKILLPVDLSGRGQSAQQWAAFFSRRFAAEVTVLHVLEHQAAVVPFAEVLYAPGALDQERQQQALHKIDTLLPGEMSERTPRIVVIGHPVQRIVEFTGRHSFDLIVMETRGLTGLEHMIIGSTTEQVVRKAPVPVLTIRRPQEAHEVGDQAEP